MTSTSTQWIWVAPGTSTSEAFGPHSHIDQKSVAVHEPLLGRAAFEPRYAISLAGRLVATRSMTWIAPAAMPDAEVSRSENSCSRFPQNWEG